MGHQNAWNNFMTYEVMQYLIICNIRGQHATLEAWPALQCQGRRGMWWLCTEKEDGKGSVWGGQCVSHQLSDSHGY